MIIASTNRPYDIDEGIMRRLGTRILIDLPDVSARERILNIHLKGEPLAEDVDIRELARVTPDYTGSDLLNFVIAAARCAERENLEEMGISIRLDDDGETTKPIVPTVPKQRVTSRAHFLIAKDQTPASPITESMAKIREFHNAYGCANPSLRPRGKKAAIINKVKPATTA